MTDEPDRDGILDPRASEPVAKPPEIEAFDRWAAEPDNLAAWEAACRWLAHAAGDVDEALDVARTALLLAPEGPERERARRDLLDLLADRRPLAVSAHFRPAANITDPLPRPVLRAAGMSGAVLAEGAVCLLSGAGGAAKSTLATTLALDVAYGGELADPDGATGMGRGFSGLFDVRPGPVMMASYEDPAGVVGWRLRELARARGVADAALGRVHVAHTAGLPLYGPPDNGLYNARPEPMRGWAHLWAAADSIRPALVVIDPALDAYTGDPNNLAAVREFVRMVIDLPPGSGPGPLMTPTLGAWGAKSAPAYSALLNLAYRWFDLASRAPVRGGHWLQAQDPARYPALSDTDVVAITRPLSARAARRNLAVEGWQTLRQLKDAGELRIEGRRVLPPRRGERRKRVVSPCTLARSP